MTDLAARHDVHPNLMANWKRKAREQLLTSFSGRQERQEASRKAEIKELKREMKTSNDMILKVRAPPNIRPCVPAHIYEYIHGNLNPRHR